MTATLSISVSLLHRFLNVLHAFFVFLKYIFNLKVPNLAASKANSCRVGGGNQIRLKQILQLVITFIGTICNWSYVHMSSFLHERYLDIVNCDSISEGFQMDEWKG